MKSEIHVIDKINENQDPETLVRHNFAINSEHFQITIQANYNRTDGNKRLDCLGKLNTWKKNYKHSMFLFGNKQVLVNSPF